MNIRKERKKLARQAVYAWMITFTYKHRQQPGWQPLCRSAAWRALGRTVTFSTAATVIESSHPSSGRRTCIKGWNE
jgi:hypothetical protein